ncbi:MAG: methyl-accepting chemotaxis protein [Brevibacillus sp.]|nr:methyl-accepting chemotaxis protein [Brevibacillus sp.]
MSLFRNLSTRAKLFSLIFMMAVFLVGVGFTGYYHLKVASDRIQSMYEDQLLPVKWINDWRQEMRAIDGLVYKMILDPSPAVLAEYKTELEQRMGDSNQIFENLKQTHLDQTEQESVNMLQELLTQYRGDQSEVIKMIEGGDPEQAYSFYRATDKTLNWINQEQLTWANYKSQQAEQIRLANETDSK